jgi:hypothetical protein
MPTFDELWMKSNDVESADARMFYEGGYDEAMKEIKALPKENGHLQRFGRAQAYHARVAESHLYAANKVVERARIRMNIHGESKVRLIYEIDQAVKEYDNILGENTVDKKTIL